MCSGEQVWRRGRHLNISRKAKLPEVSIAALWVDHINSETRTGQKTSFKSCCLVFLDCWQYKNLAFQILRGLSLTKTVGCLWQDEVVLLKTLLVFMCVLCVHTRRPEVNSWCFLLLLSTFLGGQSLTGCRWAPGMYPPTFPLAGEIHNWMLHGCESLDSCPYVCIASTFPRPCDVSSLRDCWLLGRRTNEEFLFIIF